ncbi:MAG: hypothetical protein AB7D06_14735 [Pedobacter sp.]
MEAWRRPLHRAHHLADLADLAGKVHWNEGCQNGFMQKVDVLLTFRLGEKSFYMLKDNPVDFYRVEEDQTIRNVVKRFQEKSLSSITRPTHSVDESLVE